MVSNQYLWQATSKIIFRMYFESRPPGVILKAHPNLSSLPKMAFSWFRYILDLVCTRHWSSPSGRKSAPPPQGLGSCCSWSPIEPGTVGSAPGKGSLCNSRRGCDPRGTEEEDKLYKQRNGFSCKIWCWMAASWEGKLLGCADAQSSNRDNTHSTWP